MIIASNMKTHQKDGFILNHISTCSTVKANDPCDQLMIKFFQMWAHINLAISYKHNHFTMWINQCNHLNPSFSPYKKTWSFPNPFPAPHIRRPKPWRVEPVEPPGNFVRDDVCQLTNFRWGFQYSSLGEIAITSPQHPHGSGVNVESKNLTTNAPAVSSQLHNLTSIDSAPNCFLSAASNTARCFSRTCGEREDI